LSTRINLYSKSSS